MSGSSSTVCLRYFQEKADVIGKGYAMFEVFSDLVVPSASVWSLDAFGQHAGSPLPSFAELQSFVYNTFLIEDLLKEENAKWYWNLVMKKAYKMWKKLLMTKKSNRIAYDHKRASNRSHAYKAWLSVV